MGTSHHTGVNTTLLVKFEALYQFYLVNNLKNLTNIRQNVPESI